MTDAQASPPRVPPPVGAEAIEIGESFGHGGVDQPLPVIVAAMVVGTVALMILGVQPVLLEALTRAHRLTEAQVGPLATAEDLALALGSAVGPAWMRRGAIRAKTAGLSLLLVLANLAIYAVHSVSGLFLLRAVAGLIEGAMMGATIVVTIQNRHPDRLNGIFLAVSALPQMALAWALPVWLGPRYGAEGGFAVLAALSLMSAASAPFLADPGRTAPSPAGDARRVWTTPVVIALAAVFLQNTAIGGAWNYLPLLVDQHHFPAWMAGAAVSGGLLAQILGASAAALWGHRAPFRATLVFGAASQTVVIGALALAATPAFYLAPALLFGLFWLALSPFQVRLLIHLDPSRGAALMLTAASLVGLSAGPSLSALGVRGADVTGALWIAAAIMAAACALYGALMVRRD